MTNFRKIAVSLLFFVLLVVNSNAETFFLRDGHIYIGDLTSAAGGLIQISTFGHTLELPASEVVKSEPDLKSLAKLPVEVVLKDSSVYKGKIVNFDNDIGLFLDIGFGVLTLPITSIQAVWDPALKMTWEGSPVFVFVGGMLNLPISNTNFGQSFSGNVLGEVRSPWLREFYFNFGLGYCPLNYTANSQLQYSVLNLSFGGTYKYLGFHGANNLFSFLAPYVDVGFGPSIVLVSDQRPGISPNQYGALVSHLRSDLGLELGPWAGVTVRVFANAMMIFQSNTPFTSLGTGFLVGYSF